MNFRIAILLFFFVLRMIPLSAKVCEVGLQGFCEYEESPLSIETMTPRFGWVLKPAMSNIKQCAYRIYVDGVKENVETGISCLWDSNKIISSFPFGVYQGCPLKSATRYYWKVFVWYDNGDMYESKINSFLTGLCTDEDWKSAKWIALEKDNPKDYYPQYIHALTDKVDKKIGFYKLPQFRKEFLVKKKDVSEALLFVAGLGHFDVLLNGQKIGNHFMDPGWTKYDREALYVTFDVTKYLFENNALGVVLGNGFYNIPNARYYKITGSMGAPKLRLLLLIKYKNGEEDCIISDSSWKAVSSPLIFSSIFGGEDYDARLYNSHWTIAGFNDASWKKALETNVNIELHSQRIDPVRVHSQLSVIKIANDKNGFIYDAQQNFSGVFNMKVIGKRGQKIRVTPSEILKNSQISQKESGGPMYYEYTLGGDTIETWQPRFTYYGQRYFLVEGAVVEGEPNPQNLPVILNFVALHTTSAYNIAGNFECSDSLLNDIYHAIDWSVRSNVNSIMTDCPHREKLGWLEQSHLMFSSMMYRYKLHRLYEKIMRDMFLSQTETGCIPTIAPEYVCFEGGFRDTPEWGSAFIIIPWKIYEWTGDDFLIRQYYSAMKRYVGYLESKVDKRGIVAYGLNDWLATENVTSIGVTSHLFFYYDLILMERMAKLLDKKDEALDYRNKQEIARLNFDKVFWNHKLQIYDCNSMTTNALVLYMGIAKGERYNRVLDNLLNDLRSRDYCLNCGEVGHPYLLSILSKHDKNDVIYKLHCQKHKPGYACILNTGATTLTETWEGDMLSRNHLCMGHINDWLFRVLGGIDQVEGGVGFRHLLIKPVLIKGITYVNSDFQTINGLVVSNWEYIGNQVKFHVEIPNNCIAEIVFPTNNTHNITVEGEKLENSLEIVKQIQCLDKVSVRLGSGVYEFLIKNPMFN